MSLSPVRTIALIAFALVVVRPVTGRAFSLPVAVAVEASGDLVVVDEGLAAVFRVDPATGTSTIISGAGTGAGPAFSSPFGVAVEASGDLVVTDADLDAVFRVDPVTGDRTIMSDAGTGTGPALVDPIDLAVEATGDLVVVDVAPSSAADTVFRVNGLTGDRTIISDAGTGTGPTFVAAEGIAVEASGDLVVLDAQLDAIVRVDPSTGDRTIVSDAGTGAGPAFIIPQRIAVEAGGNLVVTDSNLNAVLRVDPLSGDRTIISDAGTGAGPAFSSPNGIAVEASGDLVAVDFLPPALVRVDPTTGDRTIVQFTCPTAPNSGCTTGFAKGSLSVNERAVDKEKLVAKLRAGPAIEQTDFGDPTSAGATAVAVCVYDDVDARIVSLAVDRAGEDCVGKACWRSIGGGPPSGRGYRYKDKYARSAGVTKMTLIAGVAGKSKLQAKASNNVAKGMSSLPIGIAAALSTTTNVTVQLLIDNGTCYETTLTKVTHQESDRFTAK